MSSSAHIKDSLNCGTVKSSSSHTYCCLFDGIHCFPKHSCFARHVLWINVMTDTLGSMTTLNPLISKSSFWIGSDNVWFAIEFDPMIQKSIIQHDFTGHMAYSCSVSMTLWRVTEAARLPASNMMVWNTNTGCFHSNWSTLRTCAQFMKNSSSNRMQSSSLTFFTCAAAELSGFVDDESVRAFFAENRSFLEDQNG